MGYEGIDGLDNWTPCTLYLRRSAMERELARP